MSNDKLTTLRCFNPRTGKHDGGYCKWKGEGACLGCQAADRIEELEAKLDAVDPYLMHRDGCVWDVQDDPYGCTCGLDKALQGKSDE